MSTVGELREEIIGSILDSSFTEEYIDRQINLAIKKTSSMVLLPVLERSDVVFTEAGNPYVQPPADFGHNLFHASSAAGEIKVLSSMRLLLDKYQLFASRNITGDILHCCLAGEKIAIHPVPADITAFTVFYHTWPEVLGENGSVDAYIPGDDHQEDIIVNYGLWRLHKKIEDGLEGAMSNTLYHEKRFYDAVAAFSKTIKQGQSRPSPDRSSWEI